MSPDMENIPDEEPPMITGWIERKMRIDTKVSGTVIKPATA